MAGFLGFLAGYVRGFLQVDFSVRFGFEEPGGTTGYWNNALFFSGVSGGSVA